MSTKEHQLSELIELLQQLNSETEEKQSKDKQLQLSLQAHQHIQSNVFSTQNSAFDLTDQQILQSLSDHQTYFQKQFDHFQIQYSKSDQSVQSLIQTSKEQAEKLKPISVSLNDQFKRFEQEYIHHCQDQKSSINVDHFQEKNRNNHSNSSSSKALLESINEDLEWLKELERIQLWFRILSDFHHRTNKLLVEQSNITVNAVYSANHFDSLALEICQVIISYQDVSHTPIHLESPSSSSSIPHLNLFNYIYKIIQNSINSIIQFISTHLSQILEDSIDWPKPSRSPLDFNSSTSKQIIHSFKTAVNFQKILSSRPDLISFDQDATEDKKKHIIQVTNLNERSILLKAILDPIILRFRFHFDGSRPTNRLDKPEWYFNHILDRLAEHERFIKTDIQELFELSGEAKMDVFYEFTKQLIKLIERKLKRSVPQILDMKPILAHTIESSIRFDCAIKQLNYLSMTVHSNQDNQAIPQWLGTADVILSNPDWFKTWFEAEKAFVNDMYLEIISSNDTWEINEEDRRAIELKISGTNSSIRIQELIEQIKEKYMKLPKLIYQVEFLIHLQIQILLNYSNRINGILDGFDGNFSRFIHVVGATDSARSKIFSGFTGLDRLVKVYISSNWILKNLQSWNDDLFYVELYENLKRDKKSVGKMSNEVDQLINTIESIGGLDVTVFSPLVKRFEELSSRAEAWIVRHVVQEISSELKPYLLKRWDIEEVEEEQMELSNEIIKPISIWKSRINYLSQTIKPLNKLIKMIKMISKEIESKLISKIIMDPFTIRSISLLGARQIQFDLLYGWLNLEVFYVDKKTSTTQQQQHHHQIKLEKYFIKLLDCCKLLSFSSSDSSSHGDKMLDFDDLVKICFDQAPIDPSKKEIEFKTVLLNLLHISSLERLDCQAILKRRPECWKS